MATPINIQDPKTGNIASISKSGGLSVSPPQASRSFNATLDIDDTATRIVQGEGGRIFCVTGIVLVGTKGISATVDATVNIYTATEADLTTAVTTLFTLPVAKSGSIILTSILVEAEEGHSIVGTTTDDDVLVTILGFFVDV